MSIYSLQIEKYAISGLIKHPEAFADIESFINEKDFINEVHYTIFCVFRETFSKGEQIDKILIAQKAQNLGITFKDQSIDIFNYVNSVCLIPTTKQGLIEAAKELVKYRIRREIEATGQEIKAFAHNCAEKPIEEIITEADKIYNSKICVYTNENNKPEDVTNNIIEIIEERGNNPIEETGLVTPHQNFNTLYGGIRPGNIYAWVSRPKHGKSTILNDLAIKMAALNNGCKALVLDTEMSTLDMKFRIASSVSGVPVWHLETGNWKKNNQLYTKFQESKVQIKKLQNQVDHLQVSGKPIEEVVSIVKRWYFSKVGRGNPCIIVYDYIKLTGESDKNKQEYQLIGEKVNALKELSLELNVPILTACQLNRSAENGVDDSSAISQSDRLQWFASFVAIFRRKTVEEIAEDGQEFGSHKMIPLATRFQGRESQGHHDLVRIQDGKSVRYQPNFISFNISNFNVEERGTLSDIVEARALRPELDDSDSDGEVL
jgi:replicative DNA helicase